MVHGLIHLNELIKLQLTNEVVFRSSIENVIQFNVFIMSMLLTSLFFFLPKIKPYRSGFHF